MIAETFFKALNLIENNAVSIVNMIKTNKVIIYIFFIIKILGIKLEIITTILNRTCAKK